MCGIAGCATTDRNLRVPAAIFDALHHRGPDGHGSSEWENGQYSWRLVHTRLAIVDLSANASQPMENEDGSLVLAYNGEIYNAPELRRYCEARGHRFRSKMDGEVILHLFEMEGTAAFARLNGIFAIALANKVSGEITLARDCMGVKPMYFVENGSDLWFASEINALKAFGAPIGSPDPVALGQFLTFLWIPEPRTPFESCKVLLSGQVLQWRDGVVSKSMFRSIIDEAAAAGDVHEIDLIQDAGHILGEAVKRQMMSDVPVGLMASGGIDSSLLWVLAKEGLSKAITIDWRSDDGIESLRDDTRIVVDLAFRTGTPVDYLPVNLESLQPSPLGGDLFADPAFDLTRSIARFAKNEGIKVLLSGHGGDEVFAGYRRHMVASLIDKFRGKGSPLKIAQHIASVAGYPLAAEYLWRLRLAFKERDEFGAYMQLCTYSTPLERAQALSCTEREMSNDRMWEQHRKVFDTLPAQWSYLRRVRSLDCKVYLPGLGLAYTDRAGMEYGVEIRVPWLDPDVVRWGLRLPDRALVHRGRGKVVPRQLAAQLVPEIKRKQSKRGFGVPINMLRVGESRGGEREFRQGTYFAVAKEKLDSFLG